MSNDSATPSGEEQHDNQQSDAAQTMQIDTTDIETAIEVIETAIDHSETDTVELEVDGSTLLLERVKSVGEAVGDADITIMPSTGVETVKLDKLEAVSTAEPEPKQQWGVFDNSGTLVTTCQSESSADDSAEDFNLECPEKAPHSVEKVTVDG